LTIEHFRGFEYLDLPNLAPITLLSGKNNTGKTAVLEAFFTHAAGRFSGEQAKSIDRDLFAPLNRSQKLTKISSWQPFFHNYDLDSPVRLSGFLDESKVTVEWQATSDRDGLDGTVTRLTDNEDKPLRSKFGTYVDKTKHGYQIRTAGQADHPFLRTTARILTNRARVSQQELAERVSELKVRGFDQQLLAAMRIIDPRLANLEILLSNGKPMVHANFDIGRMMPLPLLGEGMSAVADFILALVEASNGIVLIDEIENGIHHSALTSLWEHLSQVAELTNTQIIAATHSHECVVAAYRALRDQPDRLSLIRLHADPKPPYAVRATDYDQETLESALEMNLDVR